MTAAGVGFDEAQTSTIAALRILDAAALDLLEARVEHLRRSDIARDRMDNGDTLSEASSYAGTREAIARVRGLEREFEEAALAVVNAWRATQ